MNLTFQALQKSDQPAIIQFIHEIQQNQLPGFDWSSEKLNSEFSVAQCFVLKKVESCSAFASVRVLPSAFELTCLAVDPKARGQGFGKILLGHLIDFARNNADSHRREFWLEVHRENGLAYDLYSECGFQIVGRRPNYYGKGQEALLMSLPLK